MNGMFGHRDDGVSRGSASLSADPWPRISRRTLLMGVAPLGALGVLAACGSGATTPDGSASLRRPLALIYRGPAACSDCAQVVAALLESASPPYRTAYCGPKERIAISAASLRQAKLYAQPGGGDDLDAAWRAMRPYAETISDWVRGGGHYVGFCMGGFLAGFDPGFGLLPGDSGEYITTPAATVHTNDDALVTLRWRGTDRRVYFQGGPYFSVPSSSGVDVLATYSNGKVAAMVAPYGLGSVGVTGPHPEAPARWYREADLAVPDPLPFDLGHDLIETTART